MNLTPFVGIITFPLCLFSATVNYQLTAFEDVPIDEESQVEIAVSTPDEGVTYSLRACSLQVPWMLDGRMKPAIYSKADVSKDAPGLIRITFAMPSVYHRILLLFVPSKPVKIGMRCDTAHVNSSGATVSDLIPLKTIEVAVNPPRFAPGVGVVLGYAVLVFLSSPWSKGALLNRAQLGLDSVSSLARYLAFLVIGLSLPIIRPQILQALPIKIAIEDMYGGVFVGLFAPALVAWVQSFLKTGNRVSQSDQSQESIAKNNNQVVTDALTLGKK